MAPQLFGRRNMRALFIAIGSTGDVHPLVGLGVELARRGHEVEMIAGRHFESLIRRVGFDYVPLGSEGDFDAVTSNPDLSHPRKGTELVLEHCCVRWLRAVYDLVADRYIPGETVVVSCGLALGARIVHEKLGVPLVTTHVQPMMFRSVHDGPNYAWLPFASSAPRWVKRLIYRAIDVYVDHLIAPQTNALRRDVGLPPVRRILDDWWMSPQRVLGLFPEWFAERQPDWPPQTLLTGFPLYDEGEIELPGEVEAFLGDGDPPIVFTPGSAMRFGHRFFEVSAEACRRLGRRGMLLTQFPEHVPDRLPAGVRHFPYVPLSTALPRCAAMVHHGGMGTLSQALQAGVPHLVMPMVNDQLDNAVRLARMGVAETLKPAAYRVEAVAAALDRLLNSPRVQDRCAEVARWLDAAAARGAACDAIEAVASGNGSGVVASELCRANL